MKIAMVSEHASPLAALGGADAGGQNVHVASLARALGACGHEVVIYTRRDARSLPDRVPMAAGVVVEHVPAGPSRPIGKDALVEYMGEFGTYLERRWTREPPDVAHAHFWMSGIAAHLGAHTTGVPVVQTFHALGSVKRRYLGDADTSPASRVRMEAALGRQADAVIATCNDEISELGRLGVPRQRIRVVPCGVDTSLFRVGGSAYSGRPVPRLVCVGRIVERKGFDTVIAALRRIPEAELLIVGGPPPDRMDADPEVCRLRELARSGGAERRVRFLGGVDRATVASILRSSDIAVTVPWYEPFGMVALEAMACGVPVVASAVGGHLDTVIDGTTGVLVPPRAPVTLARRVRELLIDPMRRTALGLAAADRARCRYSWDRIAAETLEVYQEVCVNRAVLAGGVAR